MIIRCKGCQSTVWLQTDAAAATECRNCGQSYSFKGVDALKKAGQKLAERARATARQHEIDLPGAYSVLLGVMTLDEVRAVLPAEPRTADPSSTETVCEFDPDFAQAVESGRLTQRQAMERGGREAYASKLARRHRLSMDLAYAVADNRISLLQAIRKRGSARRSPVAVNAAAGSSGRTLRLAAAFVVIAVLGAVALRSQQTPLESARSRTFGEAEIKTDLDGRVLQVLGPDPRTVLKTYCREGRTTPCHALDLVAHEDKGRRARLGLLRDPADTDTLLAISIVEDHESARWIAGDGFRPLVAGPAPAGAARALRNNTEEPNKPAEGREKKTK